MLYRSTTVGERRELGRLRRDLGQTDRSVDFDFDFGCSAAFGVNKTRMVYVGA
jgi:hypothetical protein